MTRQFQRRRAIVLMISTVVAIAACGKGAGAPEAEFAFGSPAEAASAGRVVEIRVTDDLTFEPAEIAVGAAETVTFRIANDGSLVHDFTLGDAATQNEHAAEMESVGSAAHRDHENVNVATIQAGETAELTWRFDGPGTVLVGCHQPGHYDAGMKAQIAVEG